MTSGSCGDALLDRRQLAGLDQLGQHRRLLERLRELRRVGDDRRPLQLADQGALGGDLSERPHGDHAAECPHHQGDRESGPEPLCPQRAPKLAHEVSPFVAVLTDGLVPAQIMGYSAASRSLLLEADPTASLLRRRSPSEEPARARRRVQLRGCARRQLARRSFSTLSGRRGRQRKQMGPYPRSSAAPPGTPRPRQWRSRAWPAGSGVPPGAPTPSSATVPGIR